jgi:hypothetical protein
VHTVQYSVLLVHVRTAVKSSSSARGDGTKETLCHHAVNTCTANCCVQIALKAAKRLVLKHTISST